MLNKDRAAILIFPEGIGRRRRATLSVQPPVTSTELFYAIQARLWSSAASLKVQSDGKGTVANRAGDSYAFEWRQP